MVQGRLGNVLHYLRRLIGPGEDAGLADGELLERFVTRQDREAFETLMQRHASMVLGVCRRILHDEHATEDAFQATFLLLVRKAGSIGRGDSVGGWLYRVAYRVALKARAASGRRRSREGEMIEMPTDPSPDQAAWRDLRPVLDEEVNKLPEKYRAPLVLCYFEGRTNAEAARELHWPTGTVQGRLARAREMLRKRLMRRGIALSTGALGSILTPGLVSAAVPAPWMVSTIEAATLVAAGQAGGSASVAALAEGVLHDMFLTKLKIATAALLLVGVLGAGAGGLVYLARGERVAVPLNPPVPETKDKQGPVASEAVTKDGLSLTAKLPKTVFTTKEPFSYTVAYKNTSENTLLIYGLTRSTYQECRFENIATKDVWRFADCSGAPPPAEAPPFVCSMPAVAGYEYTRMLDPGKVYRYVKEGDKADLKTGREALPTGNYRLIVAKTFEKGNSLQYFDVAKFARVDKDTVKGPTAEWTGEIASKAVEFAMVDKLEAARFSRDQALALAQDAGGRAMAAAYDRFRLNAPRGLILPQAHNGRIEVGVNNQTTDQADGWLFNWNMGRPAGLSWFLSVSVDSLGNVKVRMAEVSYSSD